MSAAEAAAARARASGDGKPVTPGTPVLEARGLVKTFGHVVGLAGVSLTLYPGEGHLIIPRHWPDIASALVGAHTKSTA